MSSLDTGVSVIAESARKKATEEERSRERVLSESRVKYRDFLESINRSSDRDIDRAMSRAHAN